jgi:hypothetical protein
MAGSSQKVMDKAQARFQTKEQKLAEQNKAMAEYQAELKAKDQRIDKLRDLRLAKEEADRAEAEKVAAEAVKAEKLKKRRAAKKAKASA